MKCNNIGCKNEGTVKVFCGNKIVKIVNGKAVQESVHHFYCEDCAKSFIPCEHCKILVNPYNFCATHSIIDGRRFCSICADKIKFGTCKRCHKRVYDDNMLCLSCVKDVFINQYSYKPTPRFYTKDGKWEYYDKTKFKSKIFAGIELEMNFDDVDIFKKFLEKYTHNDFVYLKRDGSIANNGVEIVSHPATFNYHFHNHWKEIFDMFKSTNTLGCGLHLHLSKDSFNDKEVEFLDYFVNNCTYAITQIGSRGLTNYCKKIKSRRYGYKRLSSHTDACNLSNTNTIELRFCNSTDNYKSFMKKLKNIWALIMFVKITCEHGYNKVFMNEDKKKECVKYFEIFKGDLLSRI